MSIDDTIEHEQPRLREINSRLWRWVKFVCLVAVLAAAVVVLLTVLFLGIAFLGALLL